VREPFLSFEILFQVPSFSIVIIGTPVELKKQPQYLCIFFFQAKIFSQSERDWRRREMGEREEEKERDGF
jgi:hypothetical protein